MFIILAMLAATRASPLGPPSPLDPTVQFQAPSCGNPNAGRSLWDIIRSCALTILLCTWTSVHPNIPSPDERWPRIALRRIGLMLAALIIPEAIIAWALRQRLAATELAEKHKGEGWTTTHGLFAIMGGFMEYEGNRPIRVVFPEQLKSYSLTGNGSFPRISKAEIEDKSKGDAISKGFVILQITWFVTQCIARGVQGLPITELELATVAFAALNLVIYLLWWDKPLNVQRGVRVYKLKKRPTEEHVDDGDAEASTGFWVALRDAYFDLPATILRGPHLDGFDQMPWLVRVIWWPILTPLAILSGQDGKYEDLTKVGTFYPCEWVRMPLRGGFLVSAIASAFGAIHCIGWSFTFPSSSEKYLWRFASVSIFGIPIIFVPLRLAFSKFPDKYDVIGIPIVMFQVMLYISCRLILLVLPFLCLRSLPPAAYLVAQWTSFIPHL